MGKSEGRRMLEKPRLRWVDNIQMDLREVERGHRLDRSGSGSRQKTGFCELGNEPSGSIKFGDFLDWLKNC